MSLGGAPRVAVLGAGIMGSSTALFLARAGCEVVLIDKASSPMGAASRWNEGKIHLGFLYAADPSTNSAARMIPGGLAFKALTEELIGSHLDAPDIRDPDLIIRTSGEQRLSNFLLWQAAYSELVFLPVYWPDFDRAALEQAIAEYRRRERRFGGLVAKTGS